MEGLFSFLSMKRVWHPDKKITPIDQQVRKKRFKT